MVRGAGGVSVSEETTALLRSIDLTLKTLLTLAQQRKTKQTATTPAQPAKATDADLDSKYGNGPVKFNPKDWSSGSCKGKPYSDCPPQFLEMLSDTFDYFAQKAEESGEMTTGNPPKPVAPFKRREALRCRGWAARLRAGWKPPTMGDASASDADDAMPEGWSR